MNRTLEEQHDDGDDEEKLWDAIRQEGRAVGSHEWDSKAPGAGAGITFVHLYRDEFYAEDDADCYGPFETFAEAAAAIYLLDETDATTAILVDPQYARPDHT